MTILKVDAEIDCDEAVILRLPPKYLILKNLEEHHFDSKVEISLAKARYSMMGMDPKEEEVELTHQEKELVAEQRALSRTA